MNLTSDIGNRALRSLTTRLLRGECLTRGEAADFLHYLVQPDATDAQIAAALIGLRVKGENAEELTGMAGAMRERAVPVRTRHSRFVDTAGTGSSTVKTFNISTAAAFVIAGAGLPVAKHGARGVTSRAGSADVLEALGVNTAAPAEVAERCLDKHGICFMFAPLFHRATARVAQIRREIGVHTVFNLLGPLVNPAGAPYRLVGVWSRRLLEPMALALRDLGVQKAWVVHGSDGLDEITLTGETKVTACSSSNGPARRDMLLHLPGRAEARPSDSADLNGRLETFSVSPADFGVEPRPLCCLQAGDAQENAHLIRRIFAGDEAEDIAIARDLVVINAAAALHVADVTPDLVSAAALALQSIESGNAAAKLAALVQETNR